MNGQYLKSSRKALILSIIIGVIGGLTAIGMFSISGLMISKSAFHTPLYSLMVLVATIKLFGVIRAVAKYFERLISHEATFEMLKDVRVNTFRILVQDFAELHSKWRLSELLERTVNDIEKLQNVLLRVIYPPVVTALTAIVVIVIGSFYSFAAVCIITAIMMVILVVLPLLFSRYLSKLTAQTNDDRTKYMSKLSDRMFGWEEINHFDRNGEFVQQLEQLTRQYEQSLSKEKNLLIGYDFLLNIFSMAAIWGVLYVMASGSYTMIVASFVMVTITLFEMAVPMTNFPYYYEDTKRASIRLQQLKQSADRGEYQVDSLFPLEMNDLSFRYPNQQKEVLQHIDLTIRRGDKIAIVGESGSGKSTMLSLIAGLYTSDLRVGGTPLSAIDRSNYYAYISVMQQHNHFFYGTVRENVFSEDDKQLSYYLKLYQLPFTPDTVIEAFGSNLSGGERQRLHFIRLLLRGRELWLFDEPFNGVDIVNRQTMLNTIKETSNTVVMVSHELSILKSFDHIIVMNKGKIVEQGSFDTLMELKGVFAGSVEKELDEI